MLGSFVQVLTMARAQSEIATPQITRGIEASPGHQADKDHTKERVEHKSSPDINTNIHAKGIHRSKLYI